MRTFSSTQDRLQTEVLKYWSLLIAFWGLSLPPHFPLFPFLSSVTFIAFIVDFVCAYNLEVSREHRNMVAIELQIVFGCKKP